jgi:hypothetical protein
MLHVKKKTRILCTGNETYGAEHIHTLYEQFLQYDLSGYINKLCFHSTPSHLIITITY